MAEEPEVERDPSGEPIMVKLVITLNVKGNINVSGPIADKGSCYGLLELAKDAIRNHGQNKIIQAVGPLGIQRGPFGN